MERILITGANGFIGQTVIKNFFLKHKIIAFDKDISNKNSNRIVSIKGDVSDVCFVKKIFDTYVPDVVIHCAGIAHQSINSSIDKKSYDDVNHVSTINLAKAASKANSNVYFIFLSSISVYGGNLHCPEVNEDAPCCPATAYARSKLDAEYGLKTLFNDNCIKKLDILRLAPVYDVTWSLNLEKRVLGPQQLFYLRFGSGNQRMSVLSRQNLIDFILFRIQNNSKQKFYNVFNITDERPCSFNEIVRTFKQSEHQRNRMVIKIPLWIVWTVTRVAGFLIKGKMEFIHSFYDKLAKDNIFSNKRMLDTGFNPKQTLESVFFKQ